MKLHLSSRQKYVYLILTQLSILSVSFIDLFQIRPFLNFIYLTFIPGYIILQLQPLKEFDFFETGFLSVLLSVSFTMLFGFLLNFLLRTIGVLRPLAAEVIIPSFVIFTLILTYLAYLSEIVLQTKQEANNLLKLRSRKTRFSLIWTILLGYGYEINSSKTYNEVGDGIRGRPPSIGINYSKTASELKEYISSKMLVFRFDSNNFNLVLFAILLPLISLLGIEYMNSFSNNIIIIFVFVFIILIIFMVSFDLIPSKLYPIFILSIGFSLTLMWSLRSPYIIFGADNDWEYYLYFLTIKNGLWQNYTNHILDACLSISLLPAIYYSFININSTILIRIIYPILTTISPLIIYYINKRYLPKKFAFFAVFYFMSFYNFFTVNNRVNIALLFFAGIIYLLFLDNYDMSKKTPILVLFVAALAVSHYSTAFITAILISLTFLTYLFFNHINKIQKYKNNIINNNINYMSLRKDKFININFIILLWIIILSWFIYIVINPFIGAINFLEQTITKIPLFDGGGGPRSSVLLIATGINIYGGIIGQIELLLTYFIISIICLGVGLTPIHYIKSLKNNEEFSYFIHINKFIMPKEFYLLCFLSVFILFSLTILPYASLAYDITRVYFQFLYILCPFVVIGLFKICSIGNYLYIKIKNFIFNISIKSIKNTIKVETRYHIVSFMLLIILITYFLCTTGLLYQMGSYHRTLILNNDGKEYEDLIITQQEYYASNWISLYSTYGSRTIYTDYLGRFRVIICGLIEPYVSIVINKIPEKDKLHENEYIFLRSYNIEKKKIGTYTKSSSYYDIPLLKYSSTVYFNGRSKILTT